MVRFAIHNKSLRSMILLILYIKGCNLYISDFNFVFTYLCLCNRASVLHLGSVEKQTPFLNSFGAILPPGVVRERENMLQLKIQNYLIIWHSKRMNNQNEGATNMMS